MLTEERLAATLESLHDIIQTDFEKRDVTIRREFGRVSDRFDTVDARFEQVNVRFDTVDAQFEQVNVRFDTVDARFEKVDARFEKVDARLLDIDSRLLDIDSRFIELHKSSLAQTTNWQAASPRDRIFPTAIIRPSLPSRFQFPPPSYFPDTVMHFWDLQTDRNIHKLVSLCDFYGVTQEEIIGDLTDLAFFTDDEYSPLSEPRSSSSSNSVSSSEEMSAILRTAVTENARKALACLASRLHLDFEKIAYNVGPVMRYREQQAQQKGKGVKRSAVTGKDSGRSDRSVPSKRQTKDTAPHGHGGPQSPRDPNIPPTKYSPRALERLLATDLDNEKFRESPPSAKTRLSWAKDSAIMPERIIRDASMYREGGQDTPSPKGSTIAISTPEQVKQAERRRRDKEKRETGSKPGSKSSGSI